MTPESRQDAVRRVDKLALGAAFALGALLSAILFVDYLRPAEVQLAVLTLDNNLSFFDAETGHTPSGPHYFIRVAVDPTVPKHLIVDGFYKRGQRVNGTVKFCPAPEYQLEFYPTPRMKAHLEDNCFVVDEPGTAYYVIWDQYGIGVYAKNALRQFDFKATQFAQATFFGAGKQFEEGLVFVSAKSPEPYETPTIDFVTYDADANHFEEGLTFVKAEKTAAPIEVAEE